MPRGTGRKAKAPARKPAEVDAKKTKASKETEAAPSREAELRKSLLQKRDEILKEARQEIAKYIKGENRQLVETALDDGDWSVVDLAEDINLRKLTAHHQTLVKIDEAIRKMNEGTYGVCDDCEEEISPERLKIMPFAIRCRDCQEIKEEMESAEEEGGGIPYGGSPS